MSENVSGTERRDVEDSGSLLPSVATEAERGSVVVEGGVEKLRVH